MWNDECGKIMNISIENVDKKKQYDKQYYNKNKDDIDNKNKNYRKENKDKVSTQQKEWYKNNPHRVWARATINNHKKRKFKVDITISELTKLAKNTFNCCYCGKEFSWVNGKGKKQHNSPTLDRIDNEQFMDINNIQILCDRCNTAKGVMTHSKYITHCKLIVDKFNVV